MVYVATITSKGQITLPRGLRKILGLKEKDKVVFTVVRKDTAILKPLEKDFLAFGKSVKPRRTKDFHRIRKTVFRKLAQEIANE
jgi:AbrB family looped-hinge helix DNA binding protein